MKFVAGVLTTLLCVQPSTQVEVRHQTLVREVEVVQEEVGTPVLDSFTDVEEAERQGMCLWEWMRERELEITLESVMVAGEWTDLNGGACLLIGEDDD
ncbi:MAG TPA: hypothetical protein VIG24_16770 [Acidimicrobiia bacterium]